MVDFVSVLNDTGLSILNVSVICGVLSTIVVGLRTYVRLDENSFGWDDGMMLSGLVVFIVEVVLSCVGAAYGLGTPDARLTTDMHVEAMKYFMIWMMMYVGSLLMIKISISVTILRIGATIRTLKLSIYVLLCFVIITFVVSIVGLLMLCNPVEANWDTGLILSGQAHCATTNAMVGLSYFSTASTIATDFACAVLPGFIVWNTQMHIRTKVSVYVLLSFGSLACISTIIRTPYIAYYNHPMQDLPYHLGNYVIWSNIETFIGLVAGSLPSLRRLIVSRQQELSGSSKSRCANVPRESSHAGLVNFSNRPTSARHGLARFNNPTDQGVSVATVQGGREWNQLEDGECEKIDLEQGHTIRADYTFSVETIESDPEEERERSTPSPTSTLGRGSITSIFRVSEKSEA